MTSDLSSTSFTRGAGTDTPFPPRGNTPASTAAPSSRFSPYLAHAAVLHSLTADTSLFSDSCLETERYQMLLLAAQLSAPASPVNIPCPALWCPQPAAVASPPKPRPSQRRRSCPWRRSGEGLGAWVLVTGGSPYAAILANRSGLTQQPVVVAS